MVSPLRFLGPRATLLDPEQQARSAADRAMLRRRVEADSSALRASLERYRSRLGEGRLPLLRDLATHRARALAAVEQLRRVSHPADRWVLPFLPEEGDLLALRGRLWAELGAPELVAEVASPWDMPDPYQDPEALTSLFPGSGNGPGSGPGVSLRHGGPPGAGLEILASRGEVRHGGLTLSLSGSQTRRVTLVPRGLPEVLRRGLRAYQLPFTPAPEGRLVAAAMLELGAVGPGWQLELRPGVPTRILLALEAPEDFVGGGQGQLELAVDPGSPVTLPLSLEVGAWPAPGPPTLGLGGWAYTNTSIYGVTDTNREALVAHLRKRGVDMPWATSSSLMRARLAPDGAVRLDTGEMDRWLDLWPGARGYMVFLYVGAHGQPRRPGFLGAEVGTPLFERRVGRWVRAWEEHLRGRGVAPGKVHLLLYDEPREGSDLTDMWAWRRALRGAGTSFRVWLDPIYRDFASRPPDLVEAAEVFSPKRRHLEEGPEAQREWYRSLAGRGKDLDLFSCMGPAPLLDPYAYYRLQAWSCFYFGARASFFWAFGDNQGVSSWRAHLAPRGPFTPLFLAPDSVTPGWHMEAIREGQQDHRILTALARELEELRGRSRLSGPDPTREPGPEAAWAERVRSLLEQGVPEVLASATGTRRRWDEPRDRHAADRLRRRALALGLEKQQLDR